jgi:hypothetical protein
MKTNLLEVSKESDDAQRLHLGEGRVIRSSARKHHPVHSEPNLKATEMQEQVIRRQSHSTVKCVDGRAHSMTGSTANTSVHRSAITANGASKEPLISREPSDSHVPGPHPLRVAPTVDLRERSGHLLPEADISWVRCGPLITLGAQYHLAMLCTRNG